MKNGFVIFLAAFAVLLASWTAFVLGPQLQLGREKQAPVLNSAEVYPRTRPGEANQGLQVYRANGCAACHTEQVQQDGVACEVMLTSVGKNPAVIEKQINAVFAPSSSFLEGVQFITDGQAVPYGGPPPVNISHLPQPVAWRLDKEKADAVADAITSAGGKAEIQIVATGPDIARGWGLRRSVAEDFLYDNVVQLGSFRIGPDLAGVGARLPDANWQLVHLYAPKSVVKDSLMPPFRYLFEVRKKINGESSPDALNLPKEFAPADDCEVVPKPEAKQLAAYLLSLHADAPLYDAPFTPVVSAKP